MSRAEHMEAEARRWEASAAQHEGAGDAAGGRFARDQAKMIRARIAEMQRLRQAAVRFA